MLFDKNGMLCLDEEIVKQSTFKKIMEDNLVTDEEVDQQSERVIALLKQLEKDFTPEQMKRVEEVLTEIGVLYAVSRYKELQEFHR